MPALTDGESEFMELLGEHGLSTVAEVREQLEVNAAYTTVLSILRTLQTKGCAGPAKDGQAHRLFRGSTELLLTHAMSSQKLPAAEITRIRQLLSRQRRKTKR